jgi:membrane protein
MAAIKILATLRIFWNKCRRDKINAYSAQSAFFMMLSMIPFLMVFSSMIRYTSISEEMVAKVISHLMPDYISPFIISLVEEVYARDTGITVITAVAAIWSAAKGVQYLTDGLNCVNGLRETRNWFILRGWAIVYTVVFLIAIVFSLLILVFGNSLKGLAEQYIPFLSGFMNVMTYLRGLIVLGALIIFFIIVFTALPNRKLSFKSQIPGAVICGVSWYIFSFGLSVYVDYFNGFSMYGSLTTIALIMLWLYFCMYILMISAEINVFFCRKP